MMNDKIDWLVPIAGVTYEIGPLNVQQVGEIETLLREGALIPIRPHGGTINWPGVAWSFTKDCSYA